MLTKEQVIDKIKRRFGYPVINCELDDNQISDFINEARDYWIEWSDTGNQDTWFTVMLSGGQSIYDMPLGVTEIIDYDVEGSSLGGFGLFSIGNQMINSGLFPISNTGFNLVSYQLALSFYDLLDKYVVDEYNYKYHPYTNQLEIQPTPLTGNSLTVNGVTYDSPGFMLIHASMIEGSTLPGYDPETTNQNFYGEKWVLDYAYALSMRTLGYIRRKFQNSTMLGNANTSLDGAEMVSEANELIEKLEDKLKTEESQGYGIDIG